LREDWNIAVLSVPYVNHTLAALRGGAADRTTVVLFTNAAIVVEKIGRSISTAGETPGMAYPEPAALLAIDDTAPELSTAVPVAP
jgi:hypothetical protein